MAQKIYLVRGLGITERAFRNRADAERYSFENIPLSANPFQRCFLLTEQDALVLYPLYFNDRNLTHYLEYGDSPARDLFQAFHAENSTELFFPVAPANQPPPRILPLRELKSLAVVLGLTLPEVSGEQEVEPWFTWWEEAKAQLTEEQQRYFWSHVLPHPHAIVELDWED